MAGCENVHARSISFPSRLHSDAVNIEVELNKLRPEKLSSTHARSNAEAIKGGLARLAELFPCVEELIQSPSTQQALRRNYTRLVDGNLDTSVALLDACGNIKDMFSMMKEQVQGLMSALRRKGCKAGIESNVHSYICFRKKMKKDIAKCLESLKELDRHIIQCPVNLEHNELSVVKVLMELKNVIICIFRATLMFLSMPAIEARATRWSLISKLIHTGWVGSKGKIAFNEVDHVDHAVYNLQHKASNAEVDLQGTQMRLDTLNDGIQALEAGLDSMHRCLIRFRVCLLNIITP